MNRALSIILLSLATGNASASDYICFRATGKFRPVDGEISSQAWQRTPILRLPDATGAPTNRRNQLRLLHDGESLFLFYRFRDLHVLIDDVSVSAATETAPVTFLRLVFSANGDSRTRSVDIDASFKVTPKDDVRVIASPRPTFENGYHWTLALRIPLSTFPGNIPRNGLDIEQSFPTTGLTQSISLTFSDHRPTTLREKLVYLGRVGDSPEAVVSAVETAQALGFNAVVVRKPQLEWVLDYARQQSLRLFVSCGVALGCPGRCEMLPEERIIRQNPPVDYQHGGEPVDKQRGEEVFVDGTRGIFSSRGRAGARNRVRTLIDAGVDGLMFDYVGYNNYYADFSMPAQAELRRLGNPSVEPQQASDRFFEEKLIEAYRDIIDYARHYAELRGRPLRLSAHIYPHFYPNALYGNKLPLDSCGQTVSWFFQPHWDFDKVDAYVRYVVEEQDRYFTDAVGAPFIAIAGVDGRPETLRHRKSAERIRQEIEIVQDAGAEAIHVAFLNAIMAQPDVARVIRELLMD